MIFLHTRASGSHMRLVLGHAAVAIQSNLVRRPPSDVQAVALLRRYVLIVEDDVVAAPGYLGLLSGAIAAAEGLQVGCNFMSHFWLANRAVPSLAQARGLKLVSSSSAKPAVLLHTLPIPTSP